MNPHPHRCRHCDADMGRDFSAGLTYCSSCGHEPLPDEAPPVLDTDDVADKQRWRISFWLCLVSTPVAVLSSGAGTALVAQWQPRLGWGNLAINVLDSFGALGILALGLVGSGYCRMKFEKQYHDTGDAFVQTIFHAGRVLFIYVIVGLGITVVWKLVLSLLHQ